MLNILLDVSRLLRRLSDGLLPTGVDRVGLAYLRHYHMQARAILSEAGQSKILNEKHSRQAFDLLLESSCSKSEVLALLARSLLAPSRQSFTQAILLHTSHNGMEQLRYHHTMQRRGVKSIFMIHDLIPLTHAEYCRPGTDNAHRLRIHTALRHADGLIANSQDTLDALETEARRANLPLPPSVVARLAPGVTTRTEDPRPISPPYFVMLGTIEPRKNHWFMLHLWRKLVEQFGQSSPKLVVIGRRGWECENVVDMLERCERIKGSVLEIPDCTDDQLRTWLQHARALVFPSFVEGYGMPLVESLALGVPVLASNLGVFHEIAGDVPDYLDPLDGPGWLTRIRAYAQEESPERNAQLARIQHFKAPTWCEHFEHVDGFLKTLFQ
ncbi:glycosyltransferase family 1 protein [Burkholderia cenocepacia]|uniref:glycosyltransferase family 4 protein n=1 Tax=Burkholderia cenocepacia TaxID=95486 RepID=UPI00209EA22D|nr:glycosyltransferase family 1 protein [Burkholderia cenocepacia]MCO8322933.1 glycosyltransferase family 4 protein [Burkholderia cenocepacia]MCO8330445.1 glycosyltransferase family 4 protein [Burkholderia cenocepacia]MCO8337730.1 glycosyltransferase family 4 protein [Burkholderia cenocepacia]MCO8344788.1 glycosyltransferase family 4 protein [Burkholderia cenocepacia]MCO8358071.1 glycosyltransferase family 4 protein [Burkholderia cenocepacia]